MEDIAERAGVTKPVLYQHFPSKGRLYLELIETVGAELLDAVSTAATLETLPYRRVLAGFLSYFRFVQERTAAFRLLFGGGAREEDGFSDVIRRVESSIAETIAELIDVDLDQEHRALLGFAIVGLAEVSSRQWVLRSGDDLPERADGAGGGGAGAAGAGGGAGAAGAGGGGADRSLDRPLDRPLDRSLDRPLDRAEGELLAHRLADLVWAGLRGLPPHGPTRAPGT
jgi:AcrR family transcriptional regulator